MKRFGTILLSVLLVLCMAMGATACGNTGDNSGDTTTPTVTVNVKSISLNKDESVKVTATVTNSDKAASFKLTGENASAVAKVETAETNAATVTALGNGTATLVVELEGAQSVSVPVTVSGYSEAPVVTPTLTVNVSSLTLMKNQSAKVTATVTNSDKNASFKLTGENASAVIKVDPAEANAATVTALDEGTATLVVELEGAQSVSIPITVDGMLRLTGLLTNLTGEYDLNASDETKKSGTFTVEHYLDSDHKVDVAYENSSVAEFGEENGTYTVTAKQAGVTTVTITVSKLKEEAATQAEEGESEGTEESKYDVIRTDTMTIVCTDAWNEQAKAEASSKLLAYKEVSGGYAAYITNKEDATGASLGAEQSNGVLRIPAIYNRKPVTTLTNCQDKELTSMQATFLYLETRDADELGVALVKADEDIITAYADIYAAVKEVYLPCTLKEIPFRAFRSADIEKVEIQAGSHITEIKSRAFECTTKLASLNLEVCRELKTIKDNVFENGGSTDKTLIVTVPNSVTSIAQAVFRNSKMAKVSFEAAKKVDGVYNPSIVINTNGQINDGTFFGAQIGTVELRNIKEIQGGNIIFNGATTNLLLLGEDIAFGTIPDNGATMAFAFTTAGHTELIFEGANNDIVGQIGASSDATLAQSLIDNCGALLGTFAGFRVNGYAAPYAIYIHKDATPGDWFKILFQQAEYTGTGDLANYTKWVNTGWQA